MAKKKITAKKKTTKKKVAKKVTTKKSSSASKGKTAYSISELIGMPVYHNNEDHRILGVVSAINPNDGGFILIDPPRVNDPNQLPLPLSESGELKNSREDDDEDGLDPQDLRDEDEDFSEFDSDHDDDQDDDDTTDEWDEE